MNFLLTITENDYSESLIDKFGFTETALFGLKIVLLGMLAVFGVLIILMLALKIFELAFSKAPKIEEKPMPTMVEAPAPVVYNTDEEVVAVIACAIAMAEAESNGLKFRVVSFRRK